MSVRVRIPAPLRSVTSGESEISVGASNVDGALVEALESKFPAIRQRRCATMPAPSAAS